MSTDATEHQTHHAARRNALQAARRLPPAQRAPQPASQPQLQPLTPDEQHADTVARIRRLAALRPVTPHDLTRLPAGSRAGRRAAAELVAAGELHAVKIASRYCGPQHHLYVVPELKVALDAYWERKGVVTTPLIQRPTRRDHLNADAGVAS